MVEDVAWHHHHESYFGSVGDDGKLIMYGFHIASVVRIVTICSWDVRDSSKQPANVVKAHSAPINSVAFNAFSEWLLATGSADKVFLAHYSACIY